METERLGELTKRRGVLKSKVTLFGKHLISVKQSIEVVMTQDPQNERAMAVQFDDLNFISLMKFKTK